MINQVTSRALPVREARQVEVSEHHGSCQEPGRGVGHALPCDVLGHVARALLEDCDTLAHIHSRKQPWPTYQASHLQL